MVADLDRAVARGAGDPGRRAALAGAAVVVAVTCLGPGALLLARGLAEPLWTPALLGNPRLWHLLLRSAALAGVVAAAAVALGAPLGAILARVRVPLGRTLFALHALPLFLPPLVLALGWADLTGGAPWLFSDLGLVLVLTLALSPVVTALCALSIASIDPALLDAAHLVAPPVRVLARLTLPSARPALTLGALVVFAFAFSELAVPMFLRVDVYPAAVFARLGGADFAPGEAAALSLPLVAAVAVLLLLERRALGARSFATLGLRRDRPPPIPPHSAATALVLAAAAAAAAPLLALGVRSLDGGWADLGMWLGTSPWNTLRTAAAAATVIALVALVVGHGLARGSPLCRALDGALLLSFFLPAAALGVGVVALWNRPATAAVYGSAAILVLGYVARYGVLGARAFAVAVLRGPANLEAAAQVAGAGYLRRLVQIVAPMHARGLAAAWLLALLFCMRDVETSILDYPPGAEPLTVRLFTLEANGGAARVAAIALVQVGLTAGALLAGAALLGPLARGRRRP